MNVYFKISILVFLVLLMSCTNRRNDAVPSNEYNSIPIHNVEKNGIDSLIKEFEVIPLETNDSSLISSIHQLYVTDKYFYIVNGRMDKVCIFDMKGKFVNSIKNKGKGPNEYISINNFEIDIHHRKLLLSDSFSKRIFIYDETGNLQKTLSLDFIPYQIVPAGNGMFFNLYAGSNKCYEDEKLESYHVHVMDSLGRIFKTMLPDQTLKRIDLKSSFTTNYMPDGAVLYNPILSDTIYKISPDSVSPLYVFRNMSDFKLPSVRERKDISYVYGVCNDYERLEESGYLLSWGGFLHTDNYLFFTFGWDSKLCLIYSKNNHCSKMISFSDIEKSNHPLVRMLLKRSPFTADNDWFYTSVDVLDTEMSSEDMNHIDKLKFGNIKPGDNPVLVRYKINF